MIEDIIKTIEKQLQTIDELHGDMDSANWGYEEGILLTGNEGKLLLSVLNKIK